MNQRETIDGIPGEWRTVTKPSELSERQPIRYEIGCTKFGNDSPCFAERCKMCRTISIFGDGQRKNIQAFFPLADKQEAKELHEEQLEAMEVAIDHLNYHGLSITADVLQDIFERLQKEGPQ